MNWEKDQGTKIIVRAEKWPQLLCPVCINAMPRVIITAKHKARSRSQGLTPANQKVTGTHA